MVSFQHIDGYVLTPQGFVRGFIEQENGRITRIEGEPVSESQVRHDAVALPIVLPGFIDVHVHGGGGHDTMEGGEAALQMSKLHVRHGTTSLLATTMTAPLEDIRNAIAALAPV